MAVDDLTTEYHLTPDGWVTGTERFFRDVVGEEIERPCSAVETWEYRIYQRSQWSGEERSCRMIWHDAAVPQTEREELRSRFRRPR